MRTLKLLLAFIPAPLFFIFGVFSYFTGSSICSMVDWVIPEMTLMWFIMSLAHVMPWIQYFEARKHLYQRV